MAYPVFQNPQVAAQVQVGSGLGFGVGLGLGLGLGLVSPVLGQLCMHAQICVGYI